MEQTKDTGPGRSSQSDSCKISGSTMTQSVRLQRNQAEKQRRDKLNGYVSEIASLVPMIQHANKPVDKVSVLRLAAAHMRLNISCLNPKLFKSKFQPLPTLITQHLELLEKTIDGFIIITTFSGTVLFASKCIEEFTGYQNIDVMGHSILNYVQEDEVSFFQRKLNSLKSRYKTGNPKKPTKIIKLHFQKRPLPRTNDISYQKMIFRLSVHSNEASTSQDQDSKPSTKTKIQKQKDFGKNAILVMFIEPVKVIPKINLSYLLSNQDIYFTIHGTKGEIMYTDHRISLITGYMPSDVLGTSAYQYIMQTDIPVALFAQRAMFTSNDGMGMTTYRLKTFNAKYIYLQSKGQIFYKDNSPDISHFVCHNKWLSDDEGEKELKKFQERYSPQRAAIEETDTASDRKLVRSTSSSESSVPLSDYSSPRSSLTEEYMDFGREAPSRDQSYHSNSSTNDDTPRSNGHDFSNASTNRPSTRDSPPLRHENGFDVYSESEQMDVTVYEPIHTGRAPSEKYQIDCSPTYQAPGMQQNMFSVHCNSVHNSDPAQRSVHLEQDNSFMQSVETQSADQCALYPNVSDVLSQCNGAMLVGQYSKTNARQYSLSSMEDPPVFNPCSDTWADGVSPIGTGLASTSYQQNPILQETSTFQSLYPKHLSFCKTSEIVIRRRDDESVAAVQNQFGLVPSVSEVPSNSFVAQKSLVQNGVNFSSRNSVPAGTARENTPYGEDMSQEVSFYRSRELNHDRFTFQPSIESNGRQPSYSHRMYAQNGRDFHPKEGVLLTNPFEESPICNDSLQKSSYYSHTGNASCHSQNTMNQSYPNTTSVSQKYDFDTNQELFHELGKFFDDCPSFNGHPVVNGRTFEDLGAFSDESEIIFPSQASFNFKEHDSF